MTEPHNDCTSEGDLRAMLERFQGPDSPSPTQWQPRVRRLSAIPALLLLGVAGAISFAVFVSRPGQARPVITSVTAASCAARIVYQDRIYEGDRLGPRDDFQRGGLLGTAVISGCRDSVSNSVTASEPTAVPNTTEIPDRPVEVFSVAGLAPSSAVMVGDQANLIYVSRDVSDRINDGKCRDAHDVTSALHCLGLLP
jgi:hypothetical protein